MKTTERESNEYRMAIGNLKQALKRRGITYSELAQGIGLSESGVKKIFSSKDGSFQRLAQICRYVGLSLPELVDDPRTVSVEFSARQQSAFLGEPVLFQFYWLLVYERRTVDFTRNELHLSKAEAFHFSRKLDKLGLIRLLPNDRLRLPSIKAVRWDGEGEFLRKIYRDWSRTLVDDVAKPEVQKDKFFLIRYLQMTPRTFMEFIAAQRALEDEFVRRSIQEMQVQAPGLEHVRWLAAVDNRSFITGRRLSDSANTSSEK